MLTFAIILQFILAISLTIIVMLQKSSSIGLGAYSGSNESVFGAKGPATAMVKITFTLSTLLILNTIFLTYQFTRAQTASVVDSAIPSTLAPTPGAAPTPAK
ncbi:MAG: preprotein translocase subunit SecG [Pseudomonadota bacterium]